MKAVLISTQPKWCELTVSEKKSVEIRKTKPKLEPPFKCYIYCTKITKKNAQHTYINSGYGRTNFGVIGNWRSGKEVVDVNSHLPAYRYNAYLAEGKVIGEFVCDEIFPIRVFENGSIQDYMCHRMERSCVPYDDIANYIGYDKTGYGWHISNLKIYDKPRPLTDFCKCGAMSLEELSDREELCGYCSDTGYGEYATYGTPNGPVMCEGAYCGEAYQAYLDENFTITRPPQSWCYVEEEQP